MRPKLLTLLCAVLTALLFAPAAALAAAPLALDVPNNGATPIAAYDAVSKTTFIAWQDPQTTPLGAIDLCVLPNGAAACEGPGGAATGGPVPLEITTAENPGFGGSETLSIGGLAVLPNGDVVVTGQPVYGGSVAWESVANGSGFLSSSQGLQNTGSFVSPVSEFYVPDQVVALSNTDIGVLDDHAGYFSDSPFAGPEYPLTIASSNVNPPPSGQTSSLYFGKPYYSTGPAIAAEPAPAPAAPNTDIVVAVGDNENGPNTQLSDCIDGDSHGTGFGLDVGTVNGMSSAAGTLNAQNSAGASIGTFSALACNAEAPTVASPEGGAQGIGVLEAEGNGIDGVSGGTYTVDYRPFIATATGGSFGSPVLLAKTAGAADDTQVVDDSTDGVYAMWNQNGLNVDYSANGGATWGAAVLIPEPATGEIGNAVITPIGAGTFLLSYTNNLGTGTQTFAEALNYQQLEQAPTTLSTIQRSGTAAGASITIAAGTIGESDTATIAGTNAATAAGTVVFALYNNSACTGTPVFSGSATATAGVASIADATSPGLLAGTYYWATAYAGDAANAPSVSPCGSEVLTVAPVATTGSTATTSGSTVSLTISCSAACTVTITLDSGVLTVDRDGHKTSKPVVLGTGTLKLKKAGKGKLTIKLNSKGKSLFKRDHDKLNATLLLSTKTALGKVSTTKTIKIKRK